MNETSVSPPSGPENRPLVVSLCGTFLKREMQSLYRQMTNLRTFRTIVMAEQVENLDRFPFSALVTLQKNPRPRARGNFILRFWYKHVIKKWPPPRPINKQPCYYPYDLIDHLRRQQPALVHVYYGHKAVKYLDMLLVWGGPFIVSFHGVDVVKFVDNPGYRENLQRVFCHAQLILARSQSLLSALEALGCPQDKLRLNRTPIPFSAEPPKVRKAPEQGQWRLVQACRLIAKKGLFTVLEALVKLVPHYPNLTFTICGTGPDELALRKRVDKLGLKNHVIFAGWKSQEQLTRIFQESHLFLHPSEMTSEGDQEGVPNSMLEAMACGLPVVATTHGGIPEAVQHGRDGLLVPEKSPAALASALESIFTQPNLLETLSQQSSQNIRQTYGLDYAIAALENCYEEAIRSHQSHSS